MIRLCANTVYQGSFTIARGVTVIGAGATSTILDGGGAGRVITVNAGVLAVLRGLQIRNGRTTGSTRGAGVFNAGSLLLNDCLVTSNVSTSGGGGIGNDGDLTLLDTGVTNNRATQGGGIFTFGRLSLRGTTVLTGNVGFEIGGGIVASDPAQVTLHDTTLVTNNDANLLSGMSGGGIYNDLEFPATVTFLDQARVTGNRPNDCTGTATCPS